MPEERLRSLLEIATAILLGLVSIATAAGAYQASVWAEQAAAYASASGQLRDASLSTYIASDLEGFDDGERLFQAIDLEIEIGSADPGVDVDDLRSRQQVILAGASEGVLDEWNAWVASGYDDTLFPTASADFQMRSYAPTLSANVASAVAGELADELGARSLQQTVASAVFALALLLLGVSGANATLKVSFALAIGGAVAFVVGVVVSLLAVVG
jgi:hypothetical protein